MLSENVANKLVEELTKKDSTYSLSYDDSTILIRNKSNDFTGNLNNYEPEKLLINIKSRKHHAIFWPHNFPKVLELPKLPIYIVIADNNLTLDDIMIGLKHTENFKEFYPKNDNKIEYLRIR
ncbi:MAG: hypothetical protein GON13_03695 [Nanoarchaeota archaeon]|nr:hypothetical protein [Nanoarchaeota archaeon]